MFLDSIVMGYLLSSNLAPHFQMYPAFTQAYITTLHKPVRLGPISVFYAGE